MLIAIAIAEEIQGFQRTSRIGAQTQLASMDLLGPGAPHEPFFVGYLLRFPPGLLVLSARASCSGLRSSYFSFWAWSPKGGLRSSKFMSGTKPKEGLSLVLAPMLSIDPWISSAMAMAMSIYRTLCVLVFFFFFPQNFTPRNAHCFQQ